MGQAAVVEAPSGVQQSKAGKAGSMWDAFDEDDAFPEADLGADDRSEHAVMGDTGAARGSAGSWMQQRSLVNGEETQQFTTSYD